MESLRIWSQTSGSVTTLHSCRKLCFISSLKTSVDAFSILHPKSSKSTIVTEFTTINGTRNKKQGKVNY